MQPEFAKEIIDIIISVIIYLSAFSLLMRELIGGCAAAGRSQAVRLGETPAL